MTPRTVLTPGEFIERYGRYFNRKRVEAIQGLGFLFVEGGAEGPYFDDAEGNRFLDMWCMGGTFSLGHRNPAVVAAAEAAMKDEDFGSLFFFSEAKGELEKRMDRAGLNELVVYVEAADKMSDREIAARVRKHFQL